jgi:hypothetical protein
MAVGDELMIVVHVVLNTGLLVALLRRGLRLLKEFDYRLLCYVLY